MMRTTETPAAGRGGRGGNVAAAGGVAGDVAGVTGLGRTATTPNLPLGNVTAAETPAAPAPGAAAVRSGGVATPTSGDAFDIAAGTSGRGGAVAAGGGLAGGVAGVTALGHTAPTPSVALGNVTPAPGAVRVACIDIGTVTCRLALADVRGGRVVRIDKTSTICDLGEGLAATGRIAAAARARVRACVAGYVRRIAQAGVAGACCTLTSAARDAANAAGLVGDLAALGLRPEVISGSVEGALTFAGVAVDFAGTPIIVADNGGGSTELAAGTLGKTAGTPGAVGGIAAAGDVGARAEPPAGNAGTPGAVGGTAAAGIGTRAEPPAALDLAFVESVDVGCRRVTERFLAGSAAATAEQVAAARTFAHDALAPAAARAQAAVPAAHTLVTCGGTVTSLVAIRDGLVPYDPARVHGATLTSAEVEDLAARLATLTVAERAALPGLQAKRASVILGGTLIVAELLRVLGLTSLVVSEHDLLFGLALSAAAVVAGTPPPTTWRPMLTRPSP